MERFRLEDVEEALEEIDTDYIPDDIVETEDEDLILMSGIEVHVEKVNLFLREGIVCYWDEKEGMFLPDYTVTVIYETDQNCEEQFWIEQGGFVGTVTNFLQGTMSAREVGQLWCKIIIPEDLITEGR